ncbi:hypothetical protein FPQ18DRAFT_367960 [Pyronema domesticum]|nr:hypothetical protein FPQ18DRAFT_367960 [Pyronema domesticum]
MPSDKGSQHEAEAESLASHATLLASRGSYKDALTTAITAAELYMKARVSASSSVEKQRLDRKCNAVLKKAELWKSSAANSAPPGSSNSSTSSAAVVEAETQRAKPTQRPPPRMTNKLSVKENLILLKSSKINGNIFPPWDDSKPPTAAEFMGGDFLDPTGLLPLSTAQTSILESWKRPHEISPDSRLLPHPGEALDLTQDIVTDCSVVASLCAASRREEKGFGPTVTQMLYPQDSTGRPTMSENGKYVVKLFFNGCYRKVVIDSLLPHSPLRALFVRCRLHPTIFYPPLLEKAYLKLLSRGYDFPGSNSGTDLLSLTGWIPEHIFLQSDETSPGGLWRRMKKAWESGDVLITLGTGRMGKVEENQLGLVGEHDYAVLELKEQDGTGDRLMLVKNPWSEGKVWRGVMEDEEEEEEKDFDAASDDEGKAPGIDMSSVKDALPKVKERLQPGTFWISLENVFRHFVSIYLNWNPSLFTHCHAIHFSWDLATKTTETSFSRNPQFSIGNPTGNSGPVWILLSRHIGVQGTTGESSAASTKEKEPSDEKGFISLYLFNTSGSRVYLSSPSLHRTPYVDSPQTLLTLPSFPANTTYTLAISSQSLPPIPQSFSLHIYSLLPLRIGSVHEPYPYKKELRGAWTDLTSGGNASSPSYPINPQFSLTISSPCSLAILLESPSPHPVHVKIVPSGSRVASVITRDILAESGEYSRSTALCRTSLSPGSYTVICSTFEAGQTGAFTLSLLSSLAGVSIKELPSETAGFFETTRKGTWKPGQRSVRLLADVGRMMGVWVMAKSQGGIRVKLMKGEEVLAWSEGGEYKNLPMGVRTKVADCEWNEEGYEVLLERMDAQDTGRWEVRVMSEGTLWVGEEEEE